MENFNAVHIFFLITGSEHDEIIWAGAYKNVVSEGSGEPALLCNLARVTLLTNWMKT